MKKVYNVGYENFGLNGENPEGEYIEVLVVADNIESAIHKFRSSLPKSLEYAIRSVSNDDIQVIE